MRPLSTCGPTKSEQSWMSLRNPALIKSVPYALNRALGMDGVARKDDFDVLGSFAFSFSSSQYILNLSIISFVLQSLGSKIVFKSSGSSFFFSLPISKTGENHPKTILDQMEALEDPMEESW